MFNTNEWLKDIDAQIRPIQTMLDDVARPLSYIKAFSAELPEFIRKSPFEGYQICTAPIIAPASLKDYK